MNSPKKIPSKISLFAPGSSFSKRDFLKGAAWLKSLGAEVSFSPDLFQRKGHLAGPDPHRARLLLDALKSGDIVIAARGGGGCGRLFPFLKKEMAALKPFSKILIGSSDVTSLYLFTQALSPQIFVYGPMVCRYGGGEFKGFEKKNLERIIQGTLKFPLLYPKGFHIAKTGQGVRGRLDGGNLSILTASLGTPYEWEPKGPILYLEDVNEPLYRVDRMLTQLSHAGKLKNFKAVLVGKTTGPASGRSFKIFRECALEYFGGVKGPVLLKIPTGHGPTQWPFFLGGTYAVERGIACLEMKPS